VCACPVPTESVESHDQPDRFPVSNPGFVMVFVAAWAAGIASPIPAAAAMATTPSQTTRAGLRMGEFLLPMAGTDVWWSM
jgi:hypothetical protein